MTVASINVRLLWRLPFIAVLLYAFGTSATQAANSADAQKRGPFTEGKTESCLFCHNVQRMRAILETPHGDRKNPDSPYAQHECESCHGPGSRHEARLRRNEARVAMIDYGAEAKTPFARQSHTCLDNCHEKDMGKLKGIEWPGSVHARAWEDAEGVKKAMSCANCHKLHGKYDNLKDRKQQAQVCYKCHEKSEREHPRFEDKGIVFDRLACWDCHDVHQLIYQEPDQPGD